MRDHWVDERNKKHVEQRSISVNVERDMDKYRNL